MSPYRESPPTPAKPREPAEPSPAVIVTVIALIVCVLLSSHRPPDTDACAATRWTTHARGQR